MEKKEYEKLYGLENSYWWFKARRRLVERTVKSYSEHIDGDIKILDVGCGTGGVLSMLSRYGNSFGVDVSPEAINYCKKRKLNNIKIGTAEKLPFPDNTFSIVVCLDVLYHKGIKNDTTALKEIHRVLRRDGVLILTDSANKTLWSRHDISAHARTRYSKNEINDKLTKCGFIILKLSYYNFFLFPLVYFFRKFDNATNKNKNIETNVKEINPVINFFLYKILLFEGWLLRYINFPFGVSIFCVAKK